MDTLDPVRVFIKDLQTSPLNQGGKIISDLYAEKLLEYLDLQVEKIWTVAKPREKPSLLGEGVFCSQRDPNAPVDQPVAIRMAGDFIYVLSYSKKIGIFDKNGSYKGEWNGLWIPQGNSGAAAKSYYNPMGFCIDVDRNRMYIVGQNRARAFEFDTGLFLWNFGSGVAGDLKDDRLYDVLDVEILPNGNPVIVCKHGTGLKDGISGFSHGHVSELNAEDGTLVNSHVMYATNTTGKAWENSCHYPAGCRVSNGLAYVPMGEANHVGVWNAETWQYVTSYTQPKQSQIETMGLFGTCLNHDETELVMVCNTPNKILSVGLEDSDFKWMIGEHQWDHKTVQQSKWGEFQDIRDIVAVDDGCYLVADYGNNRVMKVSNTETISVAYDAQIPQGFEVAHCPDGFDVDTLTLTVKKSDIDTVGDLVLALKPIES